MKKENLSALAVRSAKRLLHTRLVCRVMADVIQRRLVMGWCMCTMSARAQDRIGIDTEEFATCTREGNVRMWTPIRVRDSSESITSLEPKANVARPAIFLWADYDKALGRRTTPRGGGESPSGIAGSHRSLAMPFSRHEITGKRRNTKSCRLTAACCAMGRALSALRGLRSVHKLDDHSLHTAYPRTAISY